MTANFENILYIVAAIVLLFAGIFILRNVVKIAWKIARVVFIMLAILLIAGYFLGFVNIGLP